MISLEYPKDPTVAISSLEALQAKLERGSLPTPYLRGLTRLETLLGAPMREILGNLLTSPSVRLSKPTRKGLEAKLAKLVKPTYPKRKRRIHYTKRRKRERQYGREVRRRTKFDPKSLFKYLYQLYREAKACRPELSFDISKGEFYLFLASCPTVPDPYTGISVPIYKLKAKMGRLDTNLGFTIGNIYLKLGRVVHMKTSSKDILL